MSRWITSRWIRFAALLFVVVWHAPAARSCQTCGGKQKGGSFPKKKPIALLTGLGNHHHPVSTQNALAQKFFNQGLVLAYAFNHEEAARSFERAAQLDPKLAMAYWGLALVKGSNYNLEADVAARKAAYAALQKARSLMAHATEPERAYIAALSRRYVLDEKADTKKLSSEYKNAMAELAKKYPDDLDAATLHAESAMNLKPWQLWGLDGTPAEGTDAIIETLELVLRRDPDHIGANHLYIHAVEASRHPERAIASANRLARLAPAAGHLVHMPAHIYMRIGDYRAAAESNRVAANVDRAFLQSNGQSLYTMMYYSHNLHFLSVAHAAQGRFADAKKAGDALGQHTKAFVGQMPMMEFFVPTSTFVLARFRRWDEILKSPKPDPKLPATTALWHWSRAMAYASTGKLNNALAEKKLSESVEKTIAADATWDLNTPATILKIAGFVLDARIALAKNDKTSAIESLRKAVEVEDTLNYAEPAGWYLPARETLGGVLLLKGDHAEAEKVFRADLEKNARNGRSLFGLTQALKAQGKTYAAQLMHRQFQIAWKNADTKLRIEDL